MPTPVTESNEGGQHVEWSETFHAFVFRARIYLKRLWWIIIFTVATGVIVQKWKTRDAQPTYVSTGEMWVSNLVSVTTGASISEMVANFFQNQIHLMQSADLQNRTMANVLAQHIEYAPPHSTPWVVPHPDMLTGTSILQLTVTSNDPKFAQYFLETWMQDFLQFREENRQQAYARTNTAFESVASKYQAKMQDLETELSAYIKSHDFASVESAQKAADEVISKLGAVKDHIAEMDSQLQFLQPGNVLPSSASGAASPPSTTAPGNTSLAAAGKFKDYIYGDDIHGQDVAGTGVDEIDQGLASLKLLPASPEYELGKDQLRSLQAKYTQLGLGLGPKHPHMADLQNSIDQMLSKLQELRLQRVIQLDKVRDFLQREYAKAVETEKSLVQQNKDDNDVVIKIGDLTTQIDIVKNINYSAQQNSASLGESRELGQELLQINLHATDAQEQIVNPLRPVIEGGFVWLAAGIVIIFLLCALDGRVMSIEDLTQRFDEPMLASSRCKSASTARSNSSNMATSARCLPRPAAIFVPRCFIWTGRASARASSCSPARCPPRGSPPCPPILPLRWALPPRARSWWMPICAAASCTSALGCPMTWAWPNTLPTACRSKKSSNPPAPKTSILFPAANIPPSPVNC